MKTVWVNRKEALHIKLRRAWSSMLRRCANLNDPNYGGRGIRVGARWRRSFDAFACDMGRSMRLHVTKHGAEDTTLDRIDNDGDYRLSNCRWATLAEQARNQRRSGRRPCPTHLLRPRKPLPFRRLRVSAGITMETAVYLLRTMNVKPANIKAMAEWERGIKPAPAHVMRALRKVLR